MIYDRASGAEVVDRVMATVLLIDPAGMCQITDQIGNLIKDGPFVSKRMTFGDQGCTRMAAMMASVSLQHCCNILI